MTTCGLHVFRKTYNFNGNTHWVAILLLPFKMDAVNNNFTSFSSFKMNTRKWKPA